MSELYRYDGKTHRFSHDDADPSAGRAHVARMLGLAESPPDARYELSFYSGGIGVLDQMAIAVPATPEVRAAAIARIAGVAPDDATGDWRDELIWLLAGDDGAPDGLQLRAA